MELDNEFRRILDFVVRFSGLQDLVSMDLGLLFGFQGFRIGLSDFGFGRFSRTGFLSLLKQRWYIPPAAGNFFV
jgi:hypothetical protein